MRLKEITEHFDSFMKRDKFYHLYQVVKKDDKWSYLPSRFIAAISFNKNKAKVVTDFIPESSLEFEYTSDINTLLQQINDFEKSLTYNSGFYDPIWRSSYKNYLIVHDELTKRFKLSPIEERSYIYCINFGEKKFVEMTIKIDDIQDMTSGEPTEEIEISFDMSDPLKRFDDKKIKWTVSNNPDEIVSSIMSFIKSVQIFITGRLISDMLSVDFTGVKDVELVKLNDNFSITIKPFKETLINELETVLSNLKSI